MTLLTSKSALTTPALDDILHVVDISDTTSNAAGTSKKVTISNILSGGLKYGDMHLHNNSTVTVINTVNIPHMVQGLFAEEIVNGMTFNAGSTGAITAFADAGGGQVTVTSTAHGLSTGDVVSISGTTSYNGVFTIANALTNTYEITATFVADDATGNWYQGDNLAVDTGSGGTYKAEFHAFGLTAANNKDFEFEIFINTTAQENVESKRRFANTTDIGSIGGGGIITLNDGDVVQFAIIGDTDTTNFTLNHVNVVLHRI